MAVPPRPLACALLALVPALAGCGSSARSPAGSAASVPAYVTEPFTHQQQLVEQGARLAVADGCAACHLSARKSNLAPSFESFAGHRVTLVGGRRAVVDERFLREGLIEPRKALLKGYDPAPMIAALARLQLRREPERVAALAAFIEQIGPEPE